MGPFERSGLQCPKPELSNASQKSFVGAVVEPLGASVKPSMAFVRLLWNLCKGLVCNIPNQSLAKHLKRAFLGPLCSFRASVWPKPFLSSPLRIEVSVPDHGEALSLCCQTAVCVCFVLCFVLNQT